MNISWTGHRPNNKNMGGYDWNSSKNEIIRHMMYMKIMDIISNSSDREFRFISGGALGVDQFAFSVVEEQIKKVDTGILTIINEIAIPFKDQPNAWFKQEDKDRYANQLSKADELTYVDEIEGYIRTATPQGGYNPKKLQIRNEYMVDNADVVIAVWDGVKRGGTYNCVKYANSIGKKIIQINPSEI